MKPLSIEEIKQLKVGDWVWVIGIERKFNEYGQIKCNSQEKWVGGTYEYLYFNYGKTWIAYKNKEQAECEGIIYEFPCELGTPIYYIRKQCGYFFDDNEDNCCKHYKRKVWYEGREECNLVHKDLCSFNLEIYCEECKNRLKIEETNFRFHLRENIYGTDYYNKNLSLYDTYFLSKKQAEQKLKELRGE